MGMDAKRFGTRAQTLRRGAKSAAERIEIDHMIEEVKKERMTMRTPDRPDEIVVSRFVQKVRLWRSALTRQPKR